MRLPCRGMLLHGAEKSHGRPRGDERDDRPRVPEGLVDEGLVDWALSGLVIVVSPMTVTNARFVPTNFLNDYSTPPTVNLL